MLFDSCFTAPSHALLLAPLVVLLGCAHLGGTFLLRTHALRHGCTHMEGTRSLMHALRCPGACFSVHANSRTSWLPRHALVEYPRQEMLSSGGCALLDLHFVAPRVLLPGTPLVVLLGCTCLGGARLLGTCTLLRIECALFDVCFLVAQRMLLVIRL